MLRLRSEGHEWRHRSSDRALQLRHDGADARATADRAVLIAIPTGQALIAVVVIDAADHRANGYELVERRRNVRKGLADLDAGDFGVDGLELTPNFFWSVSFNFPHVLVAGRHRGTH